ncbi:MAG TPA: hypothetical protein VGM47_05625 [Gammaproteobacteria bacterium]|jgi:hypothetical protein
MKRKFAFAAGIALCISMSAPSIRAAPSGDLTPQDKTLMYSLVIQRLLGPDDTYDEPMPKGKVYVTATLDAPPPPDAMRQAIAMGDQKTVALASTRPIPPPPPPPEFVPWPKGTQPATQKVSKEMQAALVAAVGFSQYDFEWVTDPGKQLKFDPRSHALPGGRPILTLTQFVHLSPDRVYTSGGIYVASTVAGICWYIFKKDSSGWHLEKRIFGPVA